MISQAEDRKRIIEIFRNNVCIYGLEVSACGDREAAIRVAKRRCCRQLGVEPKTAPEAAARLMDTLQAVVVEKP